MEVKTIKTISDIGCIRINGVLFHNRYGDGYNTIKVYPLGSELPKIENPHNELAYIDARTVDGLKIYYSDCAKTKKDGPWNSPMSDEIAHEINDGGWFLYRMEPCKFALVQQF